VRRIESSSIGRVRIREFLLLLLVKRRILVLSYRRTLGLVPTTGFNRTPCASPQRTPGSRVDPQLGTWTTLSDCRRGHIKAWPPTRTIGPCVENPRSRHELHPATGSMHCRAAVFDIGTTVGCTFVAVMGSQRCVCGETVTSVNSGESALWLLGIDNDSAELNDIPRRQFNRPWQFNRPG
jgi:hypothetical protein